MRNGLRKINLVILELGPDQKDSFLFKRLVENRKIGRDITPKLSGFKRKTYSHGLTYLSQLIESDFIRPEFMIWLKKIVRCRPTILYISGHHMGDRPIFYNNDGCGLFFDKDKIKVGKYFGFIFMNVGTSSGYSKKIEVNISSFSDDLYAVIGDACRLTTPGLVGLPGAALKLQEALSGKNGKPLILSFTDKSPKSGTGTLHAIFIRCLASMMKGKAVSYEDMKRCWLKAGRLWSNKKYKKNIGLLDTDGKLLDYRGRII